MPVLHKPTLPLPHGLPPVLSTRWQSSLLTQSLQQPGYFLPTFLHTKQFSSCPHPTSLLLLRAVLQSSLLCLSPGIPQCRVFFLTALCLHLSLSSIKWSDSAAWVGVLCMTLLWYLTSWVTSVWCEQWLICLEQLDFSGQTCWNLFPRFLPVLSIFKS